MTMMAMMTKMTMVEICFAGGFCCMMVAGGG